MSNYVEEDAVFAAGQPIRAIWSGADAETAERVLAEAFQDVALLHATPQMLRAAAAHFNAALHRVFPFAPSGRSYRVRVVWAADRGSVTPVIHLQEEGVRA